MHEHLPENAWIRPVWIISIITAVIFVVTSTTGDVQADHKKSHYTYNFVNPFPFPVSIKVYGPSKYGFPDVINMPAPPSPPVPVPYPNINMSLKVKIAGKWSPEFTVPWKSGLITLPGT